MTQNTTESVKTVKPLSQAQELQAKIKAQREATKALQDQAKAMKTDRKETERKEAETLMENLSNLASRPIIVDGMELTLEEALISGKKTTITVKNGEETKERAHTVFAPSATVASIQKAVVRLHKLMAGEAIRPKSNEDAQA